MNSYGEFGILGKDLWLEILRKTHPHDRVALFSTCKAFSYLFDEVEKDAKLPANRTDARKQALLDAPPVYTTEWYLWQYEGVRSEERRLKKMAQDPYEQQREQRKRKWMTKDKDVTYEPMQSYHLAYLAAFQGHVEALTYFRDEGVPLPLWSWECAHRAAGNGNLDALFIRGEPNHFVGRVVVLVGIVCGNCGLGFVSNRKHVLATADRCC